MESVEQFIVKVKNAETPFYAAMKRIVKCLLTVHAPIPRFALPIFRAVAYWNSLAYEIQQRFAVALYRYPVFRSWCEEIGPGLEMELIPRISGPVKLWIGKDVRLSGCISITGARILDGPKFIVHDRVFIGHGVSFSVAKEIVIEEDVLIAGGCTISDYSGHPIDPEQRLAGVQVAIAEVRPVRICRNAWIGGRAIILPGVTIGEGSIVGAGTVVTKNVPPYQLCVGNPGRIIARPESVANQN
jgi:acetyltransferase-like isoleucine patch superfamily enzyme